MYINTRSRVITITSVTSILYALIQYNYINFTVFKVLSLNVLFESLLLGAIVFIGFLWIVEWNVRYIRYFTVAFFPALFVSVFSFFVRLSLLQSFFSLKSWLLSFILLILFIYLLYFLLLNSNILNISSITAVPLERAAKTAQYIFSLILCYLITIIIFSLDLPVEVRIIVVSLMFFYLTYQTFWPLNLSSTELFSITGTLGIIFTLFSLVISLWPLSPPFVAIVFTTALYIVYGLGLDRVGKITSLSKLEYLTVLTVVGFFCIFVSTWGINGRLI